jgi:hypothetical protein
VTSPTALPATRTSVAVGELGFAPKDASELMQMAKFIAESELKPQGLKTAADVFLVMAVGMSWGFDPMMALQTLHVVKGRVGLPGETCAALVQSHPLCKDYRTWFTGEDDDLAAHVQTWRKGRDKANDVVVFSMADALRAQLTGGDNWKKYPADMLLWKAVARDKRRNWADVYPGLQVKEDYDATREERVELEVRAPQPDPLLIDAVPDAEREADPQGAARGEESSRSASLDDPPQAGFSPWTAGADPRCCECAVLRSRVAVTGHQAECSLGAEQ